MLTLIRRLDGNRLAGLRAGLFPALPIQSMYTNALVSQPIDQYAVDSMATHSSLS